MTLSKHPGTIPVAVLRSQVATNSATRQLKATLHSMNMYVVHMVHIY